jgi:predicted ribonuclease YlaK
MEDSIKKVASLKKRSATKEVIEECIDDLKQKYDIEYLYAGHLRGSTLDEGSILIADEIQNFDINAIKTLFSRVGKDSIILAMGSNNQIDAQYLTKNTNALTFLMDLCGKENKSDVKVKGVKLTNVMRSKIAEWADLEIHR